MVGKGSWSGTPPVHGTDKAIDPHKKLEHQVPTSKGQTVARPQSSVTAPVSIPKPKSRTQELA